ncbi:NAC domain-containing protein 72 [Sesamum indicum]|uniref:NAC domain-containing protein 72 n=1 Tax=Sesamum indicum TaxID=4182 RepID=A0A6I9UI26_SESIN|nr:NAC domain-containing protein 72 [Sesamum indicum]
MGVPETDPLSQLSLPPGFRFYPTDEELLVQYLCRKVAGHHFPLQVIGDVDLYKFDPWDLPSKALFGEKEWYFFSPRDRKYPNGSRPNRVAGSGYWKATGTDKIITTEGRKVGIKKALVFYVGKAPKGTKTNWIMHEYRLSESPRKNGGNKLDDWVLCRIYKKNSGGGGGGQKPVVCSGQSKEYSHGSPSQSSCSSQHDDVLESFPEMNSLENFEQEDQKLMNLQRLGSWNFDWATLAGLGPIWAEEVQAQHGQTRNGMYAPDAVMDDDVQTGLVNNQRVHDSGFFPTGFGQGLSGSLDPFGIRYPAQTTLGSGFRQ